MNVLIPFLVIVAILVKIAKKNQEQARKSMQSRTPQEPVSRPVNHPVMPSVNQRTQTVDVTGKEKVDDILVRANRNTSKYAEDSLHEPDCELHSDSENILGEIQDLMICGYSGNMEFERDFLGEATELLNSYQM